MSLKSPTFPVRVSYKSELPTLYTHVLPGCLPARLRRQETGSRVCFPKAHPKKHSERAKKVGDIESLGSKTLRTNLLEGYNVH